MAYFIKPGHGEPTCETPPSYTGLRIEEPTDDEFTDEDSIREARKMLADRLKTRSDPKEIADAIVRNLLTIPVDRRYTGSNASGLRYLGEVSLKDALESGLTRVVHEVAKSSMMKDYKRKIDTIKFLFYRLAYQTRYEAREPRPKKVKKETVELYRKLLDEDFASEPLFCRKSIFHFASEYGATSVCEEILSKPCNIKGFKREEIVPQKTLKAISTLFFDPCMYSALTTFKPESSPLSKKKIPAGSFQAELVSSVFDYLQGTEELDYLFPRVSGQNRFENVFKKVRYRLLQESDARETLASKLEVASDSSTLANAITNRLSSADYIGIEAFYYAVKTGLITVVSGTSFPNAKIRKDLISHCLESPHSPRTVLFARSLMKVNLESEDNDLVRRLFLAASKNGVESISEIFFSNPILRRMVGYSFSREMALAAKNGCTGLVAQFLACEDLHDRCSEYPLWVVFGEAAIGGNAKIVTMLLDREDITDSIIAQNASAIGNALSIAVRNNHNEVINVLLDRVDFLALHPGGLAECLKEPLKAAAGLGYLHIFRQILAREIYLNQIRTWQTEHTLGITINPIDHAMLSAANYSQTNVIEFFLENEKSLLEGGSGDLGEPIVRIFRATTLHDFNARKTLLSRSDTLERIPGEAISEMLRRAAPLFRYSIWNRLSIATVKFLLSRKSLLEKITEADPKSFGDALKIAADKGNGEVLKALVSHDEVVECIIKNDPSDFGVALRQLCKHTLPATIYYFLSRDAIVKHISANQYAEALDVVLKRVAPHEEKLESAHIILQKILMSGTVSYESVLRAAIKLGIETKVIKFMLNQEEIVEQIHKADEYALSAILMLTAKYNRQESLRSLLLNANIMALIPNEGTFSVRGALKLAHNQEAIYLLKEYLGEKEISYCSIQ